MKSRVPVGAKVVETKSGTITDDGPNRGKRATITLYRGYYSQGYKSEYRQVETFWFQLSVEGDRPYTFRYSGKRAKIAREQFQDCAQAIES